MCCAAVDAPAQAGRHWDSEARVRAPARGVSKGARCWCGSMAGFAGPADVRLPRSRARGVCRSPWAGNSRARCAGRALRCGVPVLLSARSGQTEHVYAQCQLRSQELGSCKRRVIIKAEVVRLEGRDAARQRALTSITNLSARAASTLYENVYCQRARDRECALKNCTTDWKSTAPAARASGPINCGCCSRQPLMSSCRSCARAAAGTACARAQVSTLRERLLKLGAWVERARCAASCCICRKAAPWHSDWCRVARRLGAVHRLSALLEVEESLSSFKRPVQLRSLPANPHRNKAQNHRDFAHSRFRPRLRAVSSPARNDKITPLEQLLQEFMNNAG